jgi:hypothetical protein
VAVNDVHRGTLSRVRTVLSRARRPSKSWGTRGREADFGNGPVENGGPRMAVAVALQVAGRAFVKYAPLPPLLAFMLRRNSYGIIMIGPIGPLALADDSVRDSDGYCWWHPGLNSEAQSPWSPPREVLFASGWWRPDHSGSVAVTPQLSTI